MLKICWPKILEESIFAMPRSLAKNARIRKRRSRMKLQNSLVRFRMCTRKRRVKVEDEIEEGEEYIPFSFIFYFRTI